MSNMNKLLLMQMCIHASNKTESKVDIKKAKRITFCHTSLFVTFQMNRFQTRQQEDVVDILHSGIELPLGAVLSFKLVRFKWCPSLLHSAAAHR